MKRALQWLSLIALLSAVALIAYAESQYDGELSQNLGRPMGAHRDMAGHDLQRVDVGNASIWEASELITAPSAVISGATISAWPQDATHAFLRLDAAAGTISLTSMSIIDMDDVDMTYAAAAAMMAAGGTPALYYNYLTGNFEIFNASTSGGGGASAFDDLTDVSVGSATPGALVALGADSVWGPTDAPHLSIKNLWELVDITWGSVSGQVLMVSGDIVSTTPQGAGGGGATYLDDLTDVNASGASAGNLIQYNGSEWALFDIPAASNVESLDDLDDVSAAGASAGNFIQFNGSAWVLKDIPSASDAIELDDLSNVTASGAAAGNFIQYNGSIWTTVDIPAASTVQSLDDLDDVVASGAAAGNFIQYDGSNWVLKDIPAASDAIELDDLSNVTAAGASAGNFIQYNGSIWTVVDIPAASSPIAFEEVSDVSVSAGTSSAILALGADSVWTATDKPHLPLDNLSNVNSSGKGSYQTPLLYWNTATETWDATPQINPAAEGAGATTLSELTDVNVAGATPSALMALGADSIWAPTSEPHLSIKRLWELVGITWGSVSGQVLMVSGDVLSTTPQASGAASTFDGLSDVSVGSATAGGMVALNASGIWEATSKPHLPYDGLANVDASSKGSYQVPLPYWNASTQMWSVTPQINPTWSVVAALDDLSDVNVGSATAGGMIALAADGTWYATDAPHLPLDGLPNVDSSSKGSFQTPLLYWNSSTETWDATPQINAAWGTSNVDALDDLSNVSASGASAGNFIQFNGSVWVLKDIPSASDPISLDDLDDVTASGATAGNFIQFNGDAWVLKDIPSASDDISLDDLDDVVSSGATAGQIIQFDGSLWNAVDIVEASEDVELDDLTDVSAAGASAGNFIQYNGASWVLKDIPSASDPVALDDLSNVSAGGASAGDIIQFDGSSWNAVEIVEASEDVELNDLTDVSAGSPSAGNFIQYNGSLWATVDIPAASDLALDDLNNVTASGASAGDIIQFNGSIWSAVEIQEASLDTELDDLTDVIASGASAGNFIQFNGSSWVLKDIPAASDAIGLDDLDDVVSSGATAGQIIQFDGSQWNSVDIVEASEVVALDDLTDVVASGASAGNFIQYNGSVWALVDIPAASSPIALDEVSDVTAQTVEHGQILGYSATESTWKPTDYIKPYIIGGTYLSEPAPNQLMVYIPVTNTINYAIDMAGSQIVAATAATAECTFYIKKNGDTFAHAHFGAAATVGTFTATEAISMAAGDILSMYAYDPADTTLGNIGFTLYATRD